MDLQASYRHCEAVVREQAGNFRYSFPFLPAEKKRAISAVYAYCRMADDIGDGPLSSHEKQARLDEVSAGLRGAPEGPVFTALAHAAKRFDIPTRLFDELVAGVRQDLTVSRYATYADLERYCDLVASSVGLMCLQIFTYSDPAARAHAVELGRAMQLSNILRDVKEDAARGRLYLPAEDLARFGVTETDILEGRMSESMRALLRFEASRARDLFDRSGRLLEYLPRQARSCPTILAKLYRGILDRLERDGFNVFNGRASLSGPRKAWIALTGLMGSLW